MLEINKAVFGYTGKNKRKTVLENVSFSLDKGELLCILGANGVGKTTKAELTALLGEPLETRVYDADEAADRMLEAGESLFFALSGRILQAHVDENNVLQCLILRDAIPEALY